MLLHLLKSWSWLLSASSEQKYRFFKPSAAIPFNACFHEAVFVNRKINIIPLTQCCRQFQQEFPSGSAALQLCMVSETEPHPSIDLSVIPAADRAFHQQSDMHPIMNEKKRKSRCSRTRVTIASKQLIRGRFQRR
jgi:hypothetical protein